MTVGRRRLLSGLVAGLAWPTFPCPGRADGDPAPWARLERAEHEGVRRFSQRPGALPLWHGSPAAEERAAALLAAIESCDREGLEPEDYDPTDLARLRREPTAFEAAASATFLVFARDLARGRAIVGMPPRPAARGEDPATLLERVALQPDPASAFADLAPSTPRYTRLRHLLAELRGVAARGGWTPVPLPDHKLEPGDRHPAITALRRRLAETDGFTGPLDGEELDPPLAAALMRFQERHGLEPDGVIGRRTAAALAAPIGWRIAQVVLAMERLRRLPVERGPRWLLVDIAGFRLELIEEPALGQERVLLESPIIVGTRYNQTPELSARALAVTLNPYWHVPRSIAVKEILPDVKKDRTWLARNEMVVLDRDGRRVDAATVDWRALGPGNFPYRLRQNWGAKNPLGRIKLEMPNRYDVYLHDTPKKELFARAVRTFSHGCMRVARIHELATLLLAEQGWDRERIEAAIEAGGPRTISLRTQPLVHVTYLGAAVDADGTIRFREDVYGRDARLARALGLSRATIPSLRE